MLTAPLDALTRRSIAGLITGYQKYLSPHKGFVCAHRIWHRGESCSQYVKRVVVEQGFWAARPLVRSRFNDCKAANALLCQRRPVLALSSALPFADQPEPEEPPEDGTPRRDQRLHPQPNSGQGDWCNSNCANSSCDAMQCLSNCGPTDCHVAHCGGADCGAMDCGTMDCGTMDCSAIDCSAMDCSAMDCGGTDLSGCADCGSCSW